MPWNSVRWMLKCLVVLGRTSLFSFSSIILNLLIGGLILSEKAKSQGSERLSIEESVSIGKTSWDSRSLATLHQDGENLYLFFYDTNAVGVISISSVANFTFENLEWKVLPPSFRATNIWLRNDQYVLFDGHNQQFLKTTSLDSMSQAEVISLKKRRGKSLHLLKALPPVKYTDSYSVHLVNSHFHAIPTRLSNRSLRKWKKTLPIAVVLDHAFEIIETFGSYDELYFSHSGLEWARIGTASYLEDGDVYVVGNYLSPRISIYNEEFELIFNWLGPNPIVSEETHQVNSRLEESVFGLRHYIESYEFLHFIEDTAGSRLIRLSTKPEVDTTEIDKLYLQMLLRQQKDTKGREVCMAPNPQIVEQRKILNAKRIWLQIYDLSTYELLEEIPTALRRDQVAFLGIDKLGRFMFWDQDDLGIHIRYCSLK